MAEPRSILSYIPPSVRRKHICHQGHSHQNDEEVSKCNRQEKKRKHICHRGHSHNNEEEVSKCNKQGRKLQEMKAKHEIEQKVVDRDGTVHRQKITIQGDPKRVFDGMKVPGMLAIEDKKGQKQKAKKH